VQKVRYSGLDDASDAQIYTPFAQTPSLWSYLMVRTGSSGPSIAAIRQAIESTNSTLTAGRAQSMDELISTSIARPRFQAVLVASFAILGLTLAVIGIYGLVSYSVAQRTHEIGVRMAIGAQRFHVLRMVVGEGSRLALTGIVVGVAGALAASRVLASLLFEVKTTDVSIFVAVSALLAAVALLASYIPARRAMKVNPIVALRYE
jgi:putative ABC transport system permease protein